MGIQLVDGLMLSATLCEIERGLFYVTYTVDGVGLGKHLLPRYQVGTSASDAQQRIEDRARECGYTAVIWKSAVSAPSARPSPRKEAARPAH
jgi:hypothetical protein